MSLLKENEDIRFIEDAKKEEYYKKLDDLEILWKSSNIEMNDYKKELKNINLKISFYNKILNNIEKMKNENYNISQIIGVMQNKIPINYESYEEFIDQYKGIGQNILNKNTNELENECKDNIKKLKKKGKSLIQKIKRLQEKYLEEREKIFPNFDNVLLKRWDIFNCLDGISAVKKLKDRKVNYKSFNEIILELTEKINYQQRKICLLQEQINNIRKEINDPKRICLNIFNLLKKKVAIKR